VWVFLSAQAQLGSVSQSLRLNASGTLAADVAHIENEQAAIVGGIGYSRPTTRFWVVQSNGRSTCGVSFRSASSPRSAIASNDFRREKRQAAEREALEYKVGDLANIGRNYWTFEPSGAISFLSSKFGLEVTAFAGFDFNTMNDATDYQTGDQFHLDGVIAQHLPLFGGFIGAGVNGYFYQQITGDSGSGAKLGGFEGMTAGIGPDCSYAYRIGDFDLAGEVKWLPELGVSNRLDGNTVWFKLGVSWGPKPAKPVESM
jgi:hypothetical protein